MTSLPDPRTDAEIPGFLTALELPGLADIHIHFLPARMQQKVWAVFDNAAEVDGYDWPITYRFDVATRLEILRGFRIPAIPALTYPHKPGMAAWLNDWNAAFAAEHADVIHCGTLYPEEGVGDYVRQALDAGARLFKMHVQVGDFAPDSPLLAPAWEALAAAEVPVVIHVGSGPRPGRFTGPEHMRQVLADFPQLHAVIAHMGMPEYHAFADLAEDFEHVHLDTTMFATDFTNRMAPFDERYRSRLAELRERVVLGSDFPTIPYPYAHQLEALARLRLGEEWLRAVLWDNGARLLGLPARSS
ncbi:amidohydrolase family protein [Brevibacterium otitidis]|uniref:Amidohydrolase family protein n=1 Tax=Brevibacterium otitidis TaxID=53364 RepID=A0ABV5X1C0_9MICO|nr:amidohydrolase family protein [Brevibacterium otitidis]BFF08677.1 amidohydrolase family protein [Brevibacterium otitidis]